VPGSVANAAPSGVMPLAVARLFGEARGLPVRENEYRDGTLQRVREASTSRRKFTSTARLGAAELVALRTFWVAAGVGAFYYYHLKEAPVYDATGVATAGRYTVRFEGGWSEGMEMARGEAAVTLVEVA
jgi:hypothetical protein